MGQLLVYSSVSVQLYDYFGIIVESLWVYESRFSKNIYFPHRFEWFYKAPELVWSRFGVTMGPPLAYESDFGSISERLRSHFGVTFGI